MKIKVFLWGKKRKHGPFEINEVTRYKFKNGFLCLYLPSGKIINYNLKFVEGLKWETRVGFKIFAFVLISLIAMFVANA